ncbi:MAG: peptidylprolyl isomerase [Verrucomicrobiota bacterium]
MIAARGNAVLFDKISAEREGDFMGLVINGESVSEWTLEEEFDAIKEHHERLGDVVCCDRDEEFRGYARDNVLNRTLLKQESVRKFGLPAEDAISLEIERLTEEHGGEEAFHQNIGIPKEKQADIRKQVGDTLLVKQILDDAVGTETEPTDEELTAFCEENQSDYQTPEECRVWHLFLEPTGAEQAEVDYETLRQARSELRQGTVDFEEKVKELCREDHEMDMGFFNRGTFLPELEAIIFSLEIDEVSPIAASPVGYHLFKLVERKAPEPLPFEEIRDRLVEDFELYRRESRVAKLIERLKDEAEVEETEEEEVEAVA